MDQDSQDLRRLVEERTEKLRRYTNRLEILQEIDRGILAANSPQTIAQAAMLHISEFIPCVRASVGLFDYDASESIVLAISFRAETKLGLGAKLPLDAFDLDQLRRGGIQLLRDTGSDADSFTDQRLCADGVRSWFSAGR